ncbi:MAG: Mrp/NBP35 family ATP-binding protein [Paramuribaculum sp.]|nr:Mrp/NBP35 family ATP-binding protein [Paramuribaculum sp.]
MEDRLYPALILDTLSKVRYPGNGKNIVELGMVEDDIRIDGNKVSFTLKFDKPTDPFMKSVVKAAETTLKTFISPDLQVSIATATAEPVKKSAPVLPRVKNIVGISSGKGGVGKSTVSVNLAVALAAKGYKVGLLDADIFGPSIPKMFGVEDEPVYMHEVDGHPLIIPLEKYGVKILSIGFLVDKDNALVWRGGMASNALKQLITEADWGELDYFLIDMPPGTSDIHLTLVQTVPITGVVIVSTPQQVALADARKGVSMFTGEKIGVPVLGIVENMAWFTPEKHPDERYYIFGKGGATRLAEELGVKLLGEIPIVGSICEGGDEGKPVALNDGTVIGHAFSLLADNIVQAVDKRNVDLPPTGVVNISH